jgi:hypothetical protein
LFTELPVDTPFWPYFTDEKKLFDEKYEKVDSVDMFEGCSYEGIAC